MPNINAKYYVFQAQEKEKYDKFWEYAGQNCTIHA
jgi:hypothetical protein